VEDRDRDRRGREQNGEDADAAPDEFAPRLRPEGGDEGAGEQERENVRCQRRPVEAPREVGERSDTRDACASATATMADLAVVFQKISWSSSPQSL